MRWALLAVGALAAACHGAASCECGGGAGVGAQAAPQPPVQEDGACRNASVPAGSLCRFNAAFPQSCPDCGAGEEQYRVAHFVNVAGVEWGFGSAMVKIPAGKRAELEAFLTEHSPVACSGEIVNPPCNPDATYVELDLPWPEWVKR
jgi:hypothetical protein